MPSTLNCFAFVGEYEELKLIKQLKLTMKNESKKLSETANNDKANVSGQLPYDIEKLSDNFIKTYFYPDIQAKGECEESDNMKNFVKNWLTDQVKQGNLR